jgi:hypothetical protein
MPLFPIELGTIGNPSKGTSMVKWQAVQALGSFLCLTGASTVVDGAREVDDMDSARKVRNGALIQLLGSILSIDPIQFMFAFLELDTISGDNSLYSCSKEKYRAKTKFLGAWAITTSILALVVHASIGVAFTEFGRKRGGLGIAPKSSVALASFVYY